MFNEPRRKREETRLKVAEGDEIIIVRNKEETELLIIKHNREHFSKVKNTKAHKDKTHNSMNENKTRDLNRED